MLALEVHQDIDARRSDRIEQRLKFIRRLLTVQSAHLPGNVLLRRYSLRVSVFSAMIGLGTANVAGNITGNVTDSML